MKIIAATLTPFNGAFDGTPFQGYYDPEKEKIRLALNAFLRSGAFDGVIDFDNVIADPHNPALSGEVRQGRSSASEFCWLCGDGIGDRLEDPHDAIGRSKVVVHPTYYEERRAAPLILNDVPN